MMMMWLRQLFGSYRVLIVVGLVIRKEADCSVNSNSNFNASLRDYSVKEDLNTTDIKTLQNEDQVRYVRFPPQRGHIKQGALDSAISSSSHSRGLLHGEHLEHPGFSPHNYEDAPHYEYSHHPHGLGHHLNELSHHPHYSFDHHHGHDFHLDHHHHKHFDPGLTAKAILLPVAGLAILGAAAALVSNPILLQLGVVSGRKRRDIEAYSNPKYFFDKFIQWSPMTTENPLKFNASELKGSRKSVPGTKSRAQPKNSRRHPAAAQSAIYNVTSDVRQQYNGEDGFVPIPLKMRGDRE